MPTLSNRYILSEIAVVSPVRMVLTAWGKKLRVVNVAAR